MKIVIDARESGTSTGRYIDKLIENLHKLRAPHEISLLTKPQRVDYFQKLTPNFEVIETSFRAFSFGEQLGFKKQIESMKPDLVHFPMVQQPILYRGKVVTSMLDLTTVRFSNPSKNPVVFKIKQIVYAFVNRVAARKSAAIICISNYVKNDVVAYTNVAPDKIAVTYNAADKITDEPKELPNLAGKQFLMYVGRPLPHKNLERLVEAFTYLQKDYPDLKLVLAGKKDALYEAHERSINERGIKNVVFTGFVSEGELRWLYEHTACYVVPSLSEGFGLPGLEAMINGAPVASSNATCLPEVYGDAVLYFDPLDSRAVADTINTIISDKKVAEDLKKQGLDQAKKYSWKRMAEQTLEVYERALLS